jgi:hypothetical protein
VRGKAGAAPEWGDRGITESAVARQYPVPCGIIDDSARDYILAGSMLRLLVASCRRSARPCAFDATSVIRPADRLFWILLRRLWSGWAASLVIIQPNTVVRWHRAGFRIYWNWLSRRGERSVGRALAAPVVAAERQL